MDWVTFKAVRDPYTREAWRLTLEELAACPRCAAGTWLMPFPAGGAPVESGPDGADPRSLPPLDGAVFVCFQPECQSLYVVVFNAGREAEFDALIPYLREAGRRAAASGGQQGEGRVTR
ncbi:MAG: hypothetical protein HY321_19735 [Armatimonadetes bacterium]|nr:hypothetical protein [Armatimonadota bacterium]